MVKRRERARGGWAAGAVLTACLTPVLAAAAAVALASAAESDRRARAAAHGLAMHAARVLDRTIDDMRLAVKAAAHAADANGLATIIAAQLDAEPFVRAAFVADDNGDIVASAPQIEEPQALAGRGFFEGARSFDGVRISRRFAEEGPDGSLMLVVSHAYQDASGQFGGVVGAAVDVTALEDELASLFAGLPQEGALLDADGSAILSTDPTTPRAAILPRMDVGWIDRAFARRLAADQTLSGAPWRIHVNADWRVVFGPGLIGGAGALAAVLFAAGFGAWSLKRRTDGMRVWLRDFASQLAVKELDKVEIAHAKGPQFPEFRDLHASFERFLDVFRRRLVASQEQISILEGAIERRTHEAAKLAKSLRQFLEEAPALILETDAEGRLRFANREWRRHLGRLVGPGNAIIYALDHDNARLWQKATRHCLETGEPTTLELRFVTGDGGRRHVSGRLLSASDDATVSIRGVFQDVTALVNAREEARNAHELLSICVQNAPAAIAMFDHDVRYIAASKRWFKDFDLPGDAIGRTLGEVSPRWSDEWRDALSHALEGRVVVCDEAFLEDVGGSKEWMRWEARPWRLASGEVGGVVMLSEVITERKLIERKLRRLADYDALTGMLNRRAFLERCDEIIKRRRRVGEGEALLVFVDLDGFKQINDTYGHDVGDQVLVEVGRRLDGAIRGDDLVGRMGGDEFVLLIRIREGAELESIRRHIDDALHGSFQAGQAEVEIRGSVGASAVRAGESAEEALNRADEEMYAAKRARKARAARSGDGVTAVVS